VEFWPTFVLTILATWRVTHLLAREDGPADLVVRLRERLGGSFFGRLMDCFHCLSLWVAAPLALAVSTNLLHWLLAWLALSGASCLLERLGRDPVVIQPISDREKESHDGMLRTQATDNQWPLSDDHDGGAAVVDGHTNHR
jgi:hypothetical protein